MDLPLASMNTVVSVLVPYIRLSTVPRVLLSKPKLVLMDESTSALDTANERRLYQALRDAGITFVSVGHRCA